MVPTARLRSDSRAGGIAVRIIQKVLDWSPRTLDFLAAVLLLTTSLHHLLTFRVVVLTTTLLVRARLALFSSRMLLSLLAFLLLLVELISNRLFGLGFLL